jgi:hypothetical protein
VTTPHVESPLRPGPVGPPPAGPPFAPPALTAEPLADRLLAPFRRFAALEAAGGLVLLACTAVALIWANSPWADAYHHLWETRLAVSVGGRTIGARSTT